MRGTRLDIGLNDPQPTCYTYFTKSVSPKSFVPCP